jgi:hypothetical protein
MQIREPLQRPVQGAPTALGYAVQVWLSELQNRSPLQRDATPSQAASSPPKLSFVHVPRSHAVPITHAVPPPARQDPLSETVDVHIPQEPTVVEPPSVGVTAKVHAPLLHWTDEAHALPLARDPVRLHSGGRSTPPLQPAA